MPPHIAASTALASDALQFLQEDFARKVADASSAVASSSSSTSTSLRAGHGVTLADWMQERLASCGHSSLPSLNEVRADTLPDNVLVRFCGMVQDVHDPEYYDGAYRVVGADGVTRIRTTKYQGVIDEPPASTILPCDDAVWQRTPVVCVPIPSRTPWLDDVLAGREPLSLEAVAAPTPPRAGKAKRPADEATPMEEEEGAAATAAAGREGHTTGSAAPPAHAAAADCGDGDVRTVANAAAKRTRAPLVAADPSPDECAPCAVAFGADGAAAWGRAGNGGVLLKVYDDGADPALRVHDLVEVCGFLERGGGGGDGGDGGGGGGGLDGMDVGDEGMASMAGLMAGHMAEERRRRPPPSAQPRLHVVGVRKLADALPSTVLPAAGSAEEAAALDAARPQLPALREAILADLASALGGDALAAEYVLLSALSRVLARNPSLGGDIPIGKLHLNLTECPPPADAAGGASPVALSLSRKLAELLPLCSRLSMAIPALNAGGLIPRKDHDANCIWPAALQLPHGAAIVLDEAVLAPGQLREAGVKGLGALKDLLEMQKVGYDFDYFAVDFPLDASLVAVSTTKSMLPFGCALPLRIVPMAPPPPPETRTPEWRRAARQYLGLVARCQHSVGASGAALSAKAQDDFVAARQADRSVSADDLGRWLTLARLVAASALAPEVTVEHYERARMLERARAERISGARSVGV